MLCRVSGLDTCHINTIHLYENREGTTESETRLYYPSGGTIISQSMSRRSDQVRVTGSQWGVICDFIVSKCGKYAAFTTLSDSPDIFVILLSDGTILHKFEDYDQSVAAFCFTDDGKYLLTLGGADSRQYFLFDLESGRIVSSGQFGADVRVVAVSSGGWTRDIKGRLTDTYVFASCGPSSLVLWTFLPPSLTFTSIVAGKSVRSFTCCAFACNHVFAGTTSGDVVNSVLRTSLLISGSGGIVSLCAYQTSLLAGAMDGSVTIFGPSLTAIEQRIKLGVSPVHSISCLAQTIVVSCRDGGIFELNFSTPKTSQLVDRLPTSAVIDFIKVGESFFTVSSHELAKWTMDGFCEESVFSAPLFCGTGNSILAIVGTCGELLGIDLKNKGPPVWRIPAKDPRQIRLSRNMRNILVGSQDGAITFFDSRTKTPSFSLPSAGMTGLEFFSDQSFALSSGRHSLSLWDLQQGRRVSTHDTTASVTSFLLLEDQTTVVTSNVDKSLVWWDLRSRDPVFVSPCDEAILCSTATTQNRALFGTNGGAIQAWDLLLRRQTEPSLRCHSRLAVTAITHDLAWIHSSGADKTVCTHTLDQTGPPQVNSTVIQPLDFSTL